MDTFYTKIMNFKHNFFNSGMFSNNRNILFIRQIPTVKQEAWVTDFATLRYWWCDCMQNGRNIRKGDRAFKILIRKDKGNFSFLSGTARVEWILWFRQKYRAASLPIKDEASGHLGSKEARCTTRCQLLQVRRDSGDLKIRPRGRRGAGVGQEEPLRASLRTAAPCGSKWGLEQPPRQQQRRSQPPEVRAARGNIVPGSGRKALCSPPGVSVLCTPGRAGNQRQYGSVGERGIKALK